MGTHTGKDLTDPDLDALAADARAGLVREIEASGAWTADPAWRAAFAAVPRHLFVPYYFVAVPGGHERLWGQSPDPVERERWVRGCYADTPLATRLRDGELISSSSQPSLMAAMLTALEVADGDTVLEIGTGTGYNAALLAHRLGDDRVTTVDLEPEITESARLHLAEAGHRPYIVTGDGARGVPGRGPYDRVVATAALSAVPRAWLAQCRPGARIVLPIATGIAVLRVLDAGHAEGRFLSTPAFFVPLRGGGTASAGTTSTSGTTDTLGAARTGPRLGGVPRRAREHDLFRFLVALTTGRLDAEEALTLWEREGRPGRERFGITVGGPHAWAWLDDPGGPYTWPLP